MRERRISHEALFNELQPLELGPEAQMESIRLFPRQAIYDRSVKSDPFAQCPFITRVLQSARHAATAGESKDQEEGGDNGGGPPGQL